MQTAPSPAPSRVIARVAAQLDWASQGQFNPDQFDGDQRKAYEQEAARIEQQWDNQPE